jgi:hypothetical protein
MIIAQRELLLTDNGRTEGVPIRVHAPEQDGAQWLCRFEIEWPEEKASRWGEGSDAVQALIIALQMIGAEVYASKYHEAGQLSWLGKASGYGFPVASAIRDLLIGDDKKFL